MERHLFQFDRKFRKALIILFQRKIGWQLWLRLFLHRQRTVYVLCLDDAVMVMFHLYKIRELVEGLIFCFFEHFVLLNYFINLTTVINLTTASQL